MKSRAGFAVPLLLLAAVSFAAAAAPLQGAPPRSSGGVEDAAVAEYRARLKEEIAAVKVEYERRVARDGKASADRWLAETAREMGRREGEAARRAQGR